MALLFPEDREDILYMPDLGRFGRLRLFTSVLLVLKGRTGFAADFQPHQFGASERGVL